MAAPESSPSSLVASPSHLVARLMALPELGFRVSWFRTHLSSLTAAYACELLDSVVESAFSGDEHARKATLPLAIFLLQDAESGIVRTLRERANPNRHPNFERMLRSRAEPDVEIELELPVPPYRKDRELTVGERRSLARRPSRLEFEKLLHDPNPLVLDQLFGSPTILEEDVLRLVTKRPARVYALRVLTKHLRFLARRRVRFALVQNPGTPHAWAMPLVSTLPREDLTSVAQNTTLSGAIRQAALELLARLPPLATPEEISWQ